MLVYQDRFSKDEIVTDAYPQSAPFGKEELKAVAFECKSRRTKKGCEDFGISANVDEDAEEGAKGELEGNVETVIDLVDSFSLQEFPFVKAEFMSFVKQYMKNVKADLEEKNPDRVAPFIAGAQLLIKEIVSQFDEFQFYLGTNGFDGVDEGKCTFVVSYYKEEEQEPRFIYLIDGLIEVKL